MFTGLVETTGTVQTVQRQDVTAPRRLWLRADFAAPPLGLGESVAIDGCCLTVSDLEEHGQPCFEVTTETLLRTTLGALRAGDKVNLERALPAGGRLGGHVVTGHVDAVGEVRTVERRDSALYVCVRVPNTVAPLCAAQGSVCMQGVSLTITAVEADAFWVSLIPHTLAVTTLGAVAVGDEVNVEADIFARYVARLLQAGVAA